MSVILISGGSDGLGKALAEKLAQTHAVVILAPDAEKTKEVAGKIGCDSVVADVTEYEQLDKAVSEIIAKHGAIDCLINNAGIWLQGPLESNDSAHIQKVMDVNATGTMLLTRAVLPYMKKAKKGRIINVVSQAGLNAKAERSIYNASKWAVTGFTKCLAEELKGSGVSVAGFYPGSMQTSIFTKAGNERDTSKYMALPDAVRAVEFIIDTPDELEIPELGIKPAWY